MLAVGLKFKSTEDRDALLQTWRKLAAHTREHEPVRRGAAHRPVLGGSAPPQHGSHSLQFDQCASKLPDSLHMSHAGRAVIQVAGGRQ